MTSSATHALELYTFVRLSATGDIVDFQGKVHGQLIHKLPCEFSPVTLNVLHPVFLQAWLVRGDHCLEERCFHALVAKAGARIS